MRAWFRRPPNTGCARDARRYASLAAHRDPPSTRAQAHPVAVALWVNGSTNQTNTTDYDYNPLFTAAQMTEEDASTFLPVARAMLPALDVANFGFDGAGGADQRMTPAEPFDDALLSRKHLNEATMATGAAAAAMTTTSKYFKKKQKTESAVS